MRTAWILVIAILMMSGSGYGQTGVAAKPVPKMGDVHINPTDGAKMVWVPAGEFIMGSTDEQTAAWLKELPGEYQELGKFFFDAEKPQRKVFLNGYWMYKYEVTVAQYRKFCEATKREMPQAPDWGWIDTHPMGMVSWQDAADYAKWAGVALPTEAQWEKAARGTDGRIYPWGNDWDATKCANSVGILKSTQPIGSYPTGVSPYGCMDMAGNVWEWCADWYDPKYYANVPFKNPTGPSGAVKFEGYGRTIEGARVLRGGSWNCGSLDGPFRCAHRYSFGPTLRDYAYGFRCARTP
jgi:formylglycine-generating enzyme required for sulfatase activity